MTDKTVDELKTINEQLRQEIEERKKTQLELERIVALSPDLIGVAGFDGYWKRINPAFMRTLGYSKEELLTTPILDFVHPDDRAATTAAMEDISAGEELVELESRYRCKDGSYRWIVGSADAGTRRWRGIRYLPRHH